MVLIVGFIITVACIEASHCQKCQWEVVSKGYLTGLNDAYYGTSLNMPREQCERVCVLQTKFACRSMDFLTTVPHACYLSSHNRHTAPTKYITDKPTDWVYVERQCPGDLRSSFYDLEQGKNFEQSTRLLNTATVATPSECAVLCLGEQYCRSFDVKPAEVEQLCHLYGDYATSLSNLRSTIGGFYGSMDKRLEDFNRP